MTASSVRIQEFAAAIEPDDLRRTMAEEVCSGLVQRPKQLPSKYLYDARGCELFDEITRLPEYYLTRAETEILQTSADDIVAVAKPEVIVELGAGYCTKTKLLIAAARRAGTLVYFVPTDVSPAAIAEATRSLPREFPALQVHGVVAEFESVAHLPRFGRQMVIFLGSTIGNLDDDARGRFLHRIRGMLEPGDSFLLGVDLVKDVQELHDAYNDAAGVTSEFTSNMLRVLNRELDAEFDLASFEHEADYNADRRRIEIYLRSKRRQSVRIGACDMVVDFDAGERMRTEISVKFERHALAKELESAGLHLRGWFTDSRDRFALALATPA